MRRDMTDVYRSRRSGSFSFPLCSFADGFLTSNTTSPPDPQGFASLAHFNDKMGAFVSGSFSTSVGRTRAGSCISSPACKAEPSTTIVALHAHECEIDLVMTFWTYQETLRADPELTHLAMPDSLAKATADLFERQQKLLLVECKAESTRCKSAAPVKNRPSAEVIRIAHQR
jgi:hypothetical protein